MMEKFTHRLSLILICYLTLTVLYFSFIVTKNHLVDQYQRAYLSLSDSIIHSRERLYYFNHQDTKAYDDYASQLVSAEVKANALYQHIKQSQSQWLTQLMISNNTAVKYAENTKNNISTLVSDLETLLRLKVSNEYSTHTTLLLEQELLNSDLTVSDKLYVSEFTLKGEINTPVSQQLQGNPIYQSLANYIVFREKIKIESQQKEKDIFTNNLKDLLTEQNTYWLGQSDSIKNHAFLTMILFLSGIAGYFVLQIKLRLWQTLAIKKALQHSEKEKSQLALVAKHAHDAIIMTDNNGKVTWANQSFCSLSGYQLTEILGKKPGEILQGEKTSQEEVKRISQAIKSGSAIEAELINYHKNGTPYWIDIAINPIFDEQKNIHSFIAVERDSTKRKALEIKLADTAQQAEVSNKAKSTFLATMSHELRTPLNGILGMAQIIESNIKDPEQHKQIQVLLESGDHLLSLLNDILDFSKIEQSKLEINKDPFDFSDVIAPITNTYIPICDDKGLTLTVNNNINPHSIFLGDKPRIRQIIFNLISNAVKFTHKGGITLTFEHSLTATKDDAIMIKVEDSGIGIRKERLDKIFDPFIQAESSTTRKYGGTGLGLAIVKQLIDTMKGCISVNSIEEKGTCFTIILPLETTIKKATPYEIKNTSVSDSVDIESPQNLSILIAEDNKVNALVAKMFCQRLGHQVTVAENGQIAVDLLLEHPFDLIIMDNHMPVMDGISATEVIRKELKLSTVIFACTADVFQEAHDNFINAGANYVLTKPIQEQGFLDAIKQHRIEITNNKIPPSPKSNVVHLKRYSSQHIANLALTEAEITLDSLHDLCGRDHDIINEFLASFINTSEECISILITAYDKNDIETIRLYSHSVKGMASNFQAHRLVKSAVSIELCAKESTMPDLADIQQLINLLEVNIHQASRLMNESNAVQTPPSSHLLKR